MPGLVIGGAQIPVVGLDIRNFHDDPRLRLRPGQDCRARRHGDPQAIVLHTTKGIPGGHDKRPQVVQPGLGPNIDAGVRVARYWSSSKLSSGAHLVVDFDGVVSCLADLTDETAFHATVVNDRTVGIEIYQGGHAELYDGQLDAVVALVDALTRLLGIQRQIPTRYKGRPLARLEAGGKDVVGVYGHRDVTDNRGEGDPGNPVMEKFFAAGYEVFDIAKGEDLGVWKHRQKVLNSDRGAALRADGIPGARTRRALEESGRARGMWVSRPGD